MPAGCTGLTPARELDLGDMPAASLMSAILVIPGSAAWSWVKVVEAASLTVSVTTFEARISAW